MSLEAFVEIRDVQRPSTKLVKLPVKVTFADADADAEAVDVIADVSQIQSGSAEAPDSAFNAASESASDDPFGGRNAPSIPIIGGGEGGGGAGRRRSERKTWREIEMKGTGRRRRGRGRRRRRENEF